MSSTRQTSRIVGDPNSPAQASNRSGDSLGSGGGVGGTNSSSSSSKSVGSVCGSGSGRNSRCSPAPPAASYPWSSVVGLADGLAGRLVVQLDPLAVVLDDGAPGVLVAVALHGTERTPVG